MLTRRPDIPKPGRPKMPRAAAVLKAATVDVADSVTGYVIRARTFGSLAQPVARGSVITFHFYDAAGTPLDVPRAGFTLSPGLERRFQYVPAADKNIAATITRPILPPPGATQLEVHLQRWSGVEKVDLIGELSVQTYEYRLPDLPRLEAADVEGAERIAWHWLTQHANQLQYLLEVQALAWRIGATRLLREASLLIEKAPEARGYMRLKSRLAFAALKELEDWLPLAPQAQAGPQPRLPHVVTHLVHDAAAPCVKQIAQTQYQQGYRPALVVPTEYANQPAPQNPYTESECEGVKQLLLHPLASPAYEQVKRTELLRLDTLLISRWIERQRVGLIHAHVGRSGYDMTLRALALATHLRVPVVMQWHNPQNCPTVGHALNPPPGSQWEEEAYAQQLRCAGRADAIITDDGWQALELRRAGIAADKIFVVPRLLPDDPAAPAPPSEDKSGWVVHLDLSFVSAKQVRALAELLPQAIQLPGLRLRLSGPEAAVTPVTSAIAESGLQEHLTQAASAPASAAQVVILLQPLPRAHASGWLSDLDSLLRPGSLVLAQRTPQSEFLVQKGRRGLTFDLDDAPGFAHALARLAPGAPAAESLRHNRATLLSQRSLESIFAGIESAYRYAVRAPG